MSLARFNVIECLLGVMKQTKSSSALSQQRLDIGIGRVRPVSARTSQLVSWLGAERG